MVKTGLKRGETVSASSFTLHKDCNYLFLGKKYELVRLRKMFPRQCACDTYLIFFFFLHSSFTQNVVHFCIYEICLRVSGYFVDLLMITRSTSPPL